MQKNRSFFSHEDKKKIFFIQHFTITLTFTHDPSSFPPPIYKGADCVPVHNQIL